VGIGETSHFLALNVNISKTIGDTSKVTISHALSIIGLTKINDLG